MWNIVDELEEVKLSMFEKCHTQFFSLAEQCHTQRPYVSLCAIFLIYYCKVFLLMNDIDNPVVAEMVLFLDPETAEIQQFLDPEIVKMDQQNFGSRKYRKDVISVSRNLRKPVIKNISGSRNCQNGEISGSRNHRNGRQILYINRRKSLF